MFQELLPELVKRLIIDSSKSLSSIRIPSKDDIWAPGFDGIIESDEKSSYIAEKVLDADLLILDDLGAEFITQFTTSELFRIVNHRLLTGKKMIFSTNLTLSELKSTYSERIVSRIIGEFENCVFFGEDIRKKKAFN